MRLQRDVLALSPCGNPQATVIADMAMVLRWQGGC